MYVSCPKFLPYNSTVYGRVVIAKYTDLVEPKSGVHCFSFSCWNLCIFKVFTKKKEKKKNDRKKNFSPSRI